MTIHEQLAQEIQTLPDDLAEEVLDFVEFVRTRTKRRGNGQVTYPSPSWASDKEYAALREKLKDDPIVGMISHGNIAERAEDILNEGITRESGWTTKTQ